MKKTIILVATFSLLLTACGASTGLQAATVSSTDALPIETQLVLGTLQLEGTDLAVTSQQAAELLPMWQVYQSLTSSGGAAQAEIDGLIEQIRETMTQKQMQAITAMNLSQQDAFALLQSQSGMKRSQGNTTQSNANFVPPDGGMAGNAPLDMGMAGGAQTDGGVGGTGPMVSTGQSQGTETSAGANRSAGVPTVLIDELIQVLEQKTGT